MKIVDMHCDTIAEIWYSQKDVAAGKAEVCKNLRENDLQLDLMKMKQGDYLLQNFAMFVNMKRKENPFESVMHLVDVFYTEMEKNKDLIGVVKNYADIEKNAGGKNVCHAHGRRGRSLQGRTLFPTGSVPSGGTHDDTDLEPRKFPGIPQ